MRLSKKLGLALVLFSFSVHAEAMEPILTNLQNQIKVVIKQKPIAEEQLRLAEALAAQKAAEIANQVNKTVDSAGSAAGHIAQSLPQAGAQIAAVVVDAHQGIFDEVVCRASNSDSHVEVSASARMDKSWQSTVRLASVLSSPRPEENLAVQFKASPDGTIAEARLVDLTNTNGDLQRELLLQDLHIDVDCAKRRKADAAIENLGKVLVDPVVKAAADASEQAIQGLKAVAGPAVEPAK